jgi:molybdate transport system permease protein
MVPAALATLLLLVPLVAMVGSTDWQALPGHLTSTAALDALRLSLVTSTVAIAFCLLLGLPLAWLMARVDFRGRGALRALVTVPLVLPPVVAGVAG